MRGLDVGERVPNFKRLSGSRESLQLHNDIHIGQPIVLWVFPRLDHVDQKIALQHLQPSHPFWKEVTTLGLVPVDPDAAARFASEQELDQTLFADDGSLIRFLAGDDTDSPLIILALDNRLRVLSRMEHPFAVNDVPETLRALYGNEPVGKKEIAGYTAPILMVPRVFEPEFCDELIARFKQDGGQPSGVIVTEGGKQILKTDPETKDRRDYYFPPDDPLFVQIRNRVTRRILPEIQQYFGYAVTSHDPFRLICYDSATGGYFRPHRDNVTDDVAHRQFALTVNLNTEEYEGGELRFAEFGQQLYRPEKGAAVVFACSMVHEAMPVTQGKRYAVVSFFYNEDEKK